MGYVLAISTVSFKLESLSSKICLFYHLSTTSSVLNQEIDSPVGKCSVYRIKLHYL